MTEHDDLDKERDEKMARIEHLNNMRKNMEEFQLFNSEYSAEIIKSSAMMLRTTFESLVQAGFSDSQAMEIIKARGTNLLGY